MLKLIEEDAESFAKKAEIYFQKRPELVAHVEEFYRMYRALAERYDNLTGELRNSIPTDLRSQGSGISDGGSDLLTPKQKHPRRKSSNRAPGFDFFLGSGGGSSDLSRKESDTTPSSSSDSEPDSDGASSKNNFLTPVMNGDGEGLSRRIVELEAEIVEVKEKLRVAEEENSDALSRVAGNGNYEELLGRITWYDEELKLANERLRLSDEDMPRMKAELQSEQGHVLKLQEQITEFDAKYSVSVDKFEALEIELKDTRSKLESSEEEIRRLRLEIEGNNILYGNSDAQAHSSRNLDNGEIKIKSDNSRIEELEEELKIRNDKLRLSEDEIASLKLDLENNEVVLATNIVLGDQLESAKKGIEMKEAELELEKKHILDLEEQIRRLEVDVSDRDDDIRKLKTTDDDIRKLKTTISEAQENFTLEKSELLEKISLASESQAQLEEEFKSLESKAQCLEEEIKRVESEKTENKHLQAIREAAMQNEIGQLKADMVERSNQMELINKNFDALKLKYDMLVAERDQLNAKVLSLKAEVSARDDRIRQMDEHLHRLHLEHVELISGSERASKLVEELKARSKTLEEEVEAQKIVVLNGAEEKREVIRQLCFSLEHYRDGYQRLRQAFLVHKRPAILAS